MDEPLHRSRTGPRHPRAPFPKARPGAPRPSGSRAWTPCQARLLEFVAHVPRARIAGIAGSGKTTLAFEHARRCAAAGRRTLLLCGTETLARWLAEAAGELDVRGLEIRTFHGLCRAVTERAGARFDEPDEPGARTEFLEWGASELLVEHRDRIDARWDAIVVDEGQDFLADWWDALESCLAEGASFHVFYDERQDVLGARGIGSLEALPQFELTLSCRSPDGVPVVVETIPDPARRRAAIEARVAGWLGESGPERVAILAPYRLARTCLGGAREIAGVPLTERPDEWRAGGGVLVATIRGFRGLEADAVAMIDCPRPDARRAFRTADLHVGRSRARRLLHLFATEHSDALAA